MKIYTKTGDQGLTSLATGERVVKTDPRIEAYGTSDELNSLIGWVRAGLPKDTEKQDAQLSYIQNRLFDLGARLAGASLEVDKSLIGLLEQWMDEIQDGLPECHEFILPAGNEIVSRCHIARTVSRRLERCMLQLDRSQICSEDLIFINRLSDYFFLLSKMLGQLTSAPTTPWVKVK